MVALRFAIVFNMKSVIYLNTSSKTSHDLFCDHTVTGFFGGFQLILYSFKKLNVFIQLYVEPSVLNAYSRLGAR